VSIPQIVLKPRKALPFFARHPWVLDSAIAQVDRDLSDGAEVDLISDKGVWIARGLYNANSRIRVRLYSWCEGESIDREFWRRRIETALQLRRRLNLPDSEDGAARLVFSEADFLSGLIVDQFANHLVVQVNSLAIANRLDGIIAVLEEILQPDSIGVRADEGMCRREGMDPAGISRHDESPGKVIDIVEHGLRYRIDLSAGQKTGFFIDQRENRRHVSRYVRDARVLDMCCYSGGFSLVAASLGGAQHVTGVDTSEQAIAMAQANATLNNIGNVEFQSGDMFGTLETLAAAAEQFDVVILDPPKFVRTRAGVNQALKAYHQLNRLALRVLRPGGYLATCSCSGNVSPELFEDMLFGVGQRSKREIQILEHHGPAPDHPVASTCPETQYLKCAICRVL
jgi:23S rRNA (cytosine1962-C5)-methyltransferase